MAYQFLLILALLIPGPVYATPIDDMIRALLPLQTGVRATKGPRFIQIRKIKVADDGAGDTGLVDLLDRGVLSRIEVGMRGVTFAVPVSTVLSTEQLPSDGSRHEVRYKASPGGEFLLRSEIELGSDFLDLNFNVLSVGTLSSETFFNEHSLAGDMTSSGCGLPELVAQKKLELQQDGVPPADLVNMTASVATDDNGPTPAVWSVGWVSETELRMVWEFGLIFTNPTPDPYDDEEWDADSMLFEVTAKVGDTTELSIVTCKITTSKAFGGGLPSQAMVITAGSSKGAWKPARCLLGREIIRGGVPKLPILIKEKAIRGQGLEPALCQKRPLFGFGSGPVPVFVSTLSFDDQVVQDAAAAANLSLKNLRVINMQLTTGLLPPKL